VKNKVRIHWFASVKRATSRVVAELKTLNLYQPVDVYVTPIGIGGLGYCTTGKKPEIQIPILSGARLAELLPGRVYTSLLDVLRHEHGHAVDFAGMSRNLRRRYWRLFGRSEKKVAFDPDIHITEYARIGSSESFAECFMLYVKWRGKWRHRRLPGREYVNGVWEKMRFLEEVATEGAVLKSYWFALPLSTRCASFNLSSSNGKGFVRFR